jgi:hypothetical protein
MLQDMNGRPEKGRIPRTEWFSLYRRAVREVPYLVEAMYEEISRYVQEHPNEKHFNSTAVGAHILNSNWSQKKGWDDRHGGKTTVSSGLFGQIMWTRFFDDSRLWTWTKTQKNISDPEEREYFV